MISIKSAFKAYLDGLIDGWDLLDVVQKHGFDAYDVTADCQLRVYKTTKNKNYLKLAV